MKHKVLLSLILLIFISCQEKPKIDTEQERNEIVQFLKDYSSFVNKNSIEEFENYWYVDDGISYFPLERDSALIGYKNVFEYFRTQQNDISKIEYASWNHVIWVNPTKSEAVVVFLSSKGIEFKNGYQLGFYPIRNTAVLSKFEGKWRLISLHESVRQK